jgi:RNA polymerase sigma factor (sigma-70 family)
MKTNELLRRYVDARSEPAFEELVKQHIDLVYSSALRQVNGDVPAAQDVTQAVFSELARNAPRLTQHNSLVGWLYTSTRFLAAKTRRAERCRRSYEQEAHEMNQLLQSDPDTTWQELRPMLDDAMHDLSATDREAVLMRYFERLPLAEIGARLGLNENAAHMRIDRALDRLRAALAKRGVTSTITALTAVLAGRAVSGAPAGLAVQVSHAAFTAAATGGGFGWGLLKLAGLMKGKLLLATSGAALVAGLVLVPQLLIKSKEAVSASEVFGAARKQAVALNTPSVPVVAGAVGPVLAGKPTSSNELVLHIVANDSGNPIAGATVEFIVGKKDTTARRPQRFLPTEMTADNLGVCEIPISRDTTDPLLVRTRIDGFVDTTFAWNRGERIPRQYTMRLARSVPIGGQVVDEAGKPVAGAEVAVQSGGHSTSEDNPYPPHISTGAGEKTVTDIRGRWRIDRFARTGISTLNIRVTHPNYVSERGITYMNNPDIEEQRLTGTYVYTLYRGVTVSGIIVDQDGQPVSGAKVVVGSGAQSQETTNQTDGSFVLTGCKAGTNQINAEAPGFALATLGVDITNNQTPLRLELRRGNLLRLRVVDTNGMPVPNAIVRLNSNPAAVGIRRNIIRPDRFEKRTGMDGRITWNSAPEGGLMFEIDATGFQSAINVRVAADGEEHLITLHAARKISGSVCDGALHQAISRFRVVTGEVGLPGLGDGTNLYWEQSRTFRDGTFRFVDDSQGAASQFKFEADGYAPFVTRLVGPDEGEVSFDIVLYPAVSTTITVLLPDGQPATNASIGLDIPGTHLSLHPGGFNPTPPGNYNNVFSTDNAGRFVLPSDETVNRIIVASPDGYAEATPASLATESTLRLQPWGRIEGTLLSGGKPAAGRMLVLGRSGLEGSRFFNAETDVSGHFVFPKVQPGQVSLFQKDAQGTFSGVRPFPVPAVTIRLGETTTVSLELYTLTARLTVPTGVGMETNWKMNAVAVGGQRVLESLKESSDGTWVAKDLPAGDYTLRASVLDSAPTSRASNIHMQATMSFTVPGNPPSGTLDLGDIMLQPVQ